VAENTIEGTAADGAPHASGLPQMNAETFPSQIFWLAITFGALFIVMWRVAVPRIGGAIEARKARIEGDLGEAERARKNAADALAAYESALAQARAKALAMADENRKKLNAEVDTLKADADAKAQSATASAEARIAAERNKAAAQVRASAADAATAIVERLIGVSVTADDAASAIDGTGKRG
jgi:F-type H+-transporting ATPase subunit b